MLLSKKIQCYFQDTISLFPITHTLSRANNIFLSCYFSQPTLIYLVMVYGVSLFVHLTSLSLQLQVGFENYFLHLIVYISKVSL